MENTLSFEDAKKKAIKMAEEEIKEHGYPKASSIPVHKNMLLQMHRDGTLKPDKEITDEQKLKYKEYLIAGILTSNFGYTLDGKIIEEEKIETL